MQMSKFSLYSDDRQRSGLDAISDIYSILRDEAARSNRMDVSYAGALNWISRKVCLARPLQLWGTQTNDILCFPIKNDHFAIFLIVEISLNSSVVSICLASFLWDPDTPSSLADIPALLEAPIPFPHPHNVSKLSTCFCFPSGRATAKLSWKNAWRSMRL